MKNLKNINWILVAILIAGVGLISWRVAKNPGATREVPEKNPMSPTFVHVSNAPPGKSKTLATNLDEYGYQISTNLAALTLKKRVFVTNNFIPTANQFLKQFPTQHHPIEAKDIAAVSVNYGVKGYVGVLAKIEADDGPFQIFTQTLGGRNHLWCFRDLTDFDISDTGTLDDLKKLAVGSRPSSISTAAEAKTFVMNLLKEYDFDFGAYLNPPVVVPYTALPNFGLWQVHYISKRAGTDQSYVDFVVDGTGQKGPFFRWVYQVSDTLSLPSTVEK